MTDLTSEALQNVDARRRGFLGKLLAGGATLTALPAISTVALGDEKQGAGKGKGGKGKGGIGGQGKGGPGQGGPDPQRMAAQMIARFDEDGDKALNEQELAAALTEMANRRNNLQGGQGKGAQGAKGKGNGGGQGKGKGGGQGKGKGKGAF